jgi:hypothetical protein
MSKWQTPALVEVSLNESQWMALLSIIDLDDPDTDNEFLNWVERLPEENVLAALPATRVRMSPMTGRPWMESPYFKQTWFQLAKSDRRALQAVYFHDGLHTVLTGNRKGESAINWLRWLAVREAHREGRSWKKARETASERLAGTPAAGQPGAMKWSYELVQRILKGLTHTPLQLT